MSKSIKNFVVGIGYDYDKKGEKQIGSGIDGIKSKALQLGAVVAGAFGIKQLTSDFASSNDMLGKFSAYMNEDVETIAAFGDALRHNGGSLEGFMSQLEGLDAMRISPITGDTGWMAGVAQAGIDPNIITQANNATEAYLAVADAMQGMTGAEQRLVGQSLGLDQASVLLLSQGRDEVEQLVARMRDIRPHTQAMADMSAEFNDNMQDSLSHIGALGDKISAELLPQTNKVLDSINGWFADRDNQEFIDDTIPKVIAGAKELWDSGAIPSAALGAGAIVLGAPLAPAAAVAGGAMAWDWGQDEVKDLTGLELPEWLFKPIEDLDVSGSAKSSAVGAYEWLFPQGDMRDSIGNQGGGYTRSSQSAQSRSQSVQRVEVDVKFNNAMFENKVIEINDKQSQQQFNELQSNIEG